MTRIKDLRKLLGYTQDKLAKLLGVSRSTVAMWETSNQLPDYSTLNRLQLLFNVPPDYIMGEGIFKSWDRIKNEYEAVSQAFFQTIPPSMFLPMFSEDKTLCSWLYTRLYFEPDELQLVRFFSFAVKDVSFMSETDSWGEQFTKALISYSPEFEALMKSENKRVASEIPSKGVRIPVVGDVAAGIPIDAIENIVDYEEIDAAMAATGEFFGLRIKGSSMEPRIKEGDVVIVRKQDDADTSDTAVVLVNGDSATVKRIKKEPSGISLIPNNPAYDIKFYSAEEIDSLPVRIIGKVVELRGKF